MPTPIENLRGASEELWEVVEQLNDRIKQVEKHIQKINPGTAAWITLAVTEKSTREFGYAKVEGKWGLAFHLIEDERVTTSWLYQNAPLHLRLEGIPKLQELIDVLAKRVEDRTVLTHKRVQQVDELLATLNETSPEGKEIK